MEDTLHRDHRERVGRFTMTITSADPTPEAGERWAQRAEVLANWLLSEWQREQGTVEEKVIDDQRRSDEDGDIRRCDLN